MVLSSIETIRRRRQGLPPLDFQTNIPKNIQNNPENIQNNPENIQNDPYKNQRLYLQPIVNLGCGFIAMSFIIFQFYLLANHI